MSATPPISVSGVTKHYGGHIGSADVSFDLFPGEVMEIIGEIGTGMSTLMRMIYGNCFAQSGSIAMIGIFHDKVACAEVCDRKMDVTAFTPELAA